MSQAPRIPGKYGKRPPKNAPALMLGPLLTGTVPAHPAAVDYIAAMDGGWQMLGNDVAGNCAAVTWANVRRMITTVLGATPSYPDEDQVWAIYETQNPQFDPKGSDATNGPGSPYDQGMDLQTLFEDLNKTPGPDGAKIVAFAKVDPANDEEVQAAIAIFGYVWTGIEVTSINEEEFAGDKPWDYKANSPVEGGHSIVTGGYGAEPADGDQDPAVTGGDNKFETWATETSFTRKFWEKQVDECWVVIWPEHLGTKAFLEGVDQTALAAAYKQITGRALPAAA